MLSLARELAKNGEVLVLDNPPEPVGVLHSCFCYLAFEKERLTFYLEGDGSIKGVQRAAQDSAEWPIVTAAMLEDPKSGYKKLGQELLTQLLAGAKRAIADGALPCM